MLYKEVIRRLHSADYNALPGDAAHRKLSPAHRKPAMDYLKEAASYKVASVLALIVRDLDEGAELVLIERTGGAGVHASQVSFPGGKMEEEETPEQTALRETEEEIGVDRSKIKLFGGLSPLFIPPSGFLVHPFVGAIEELPQYTTSPQEVKQVLQIPVQHFLDDDAVQHGVFGSARGYEVKAPFYQWGELKIWGATAMMISEISALLKK